MKTIENVGMVADSGEEEVTFCAPGVKLSKEGVWCWLDQRSCNYLKIEEHGLGVETA